MGISFNYMSFKYQDLSKVHGSLILLNTCSLVNILSLIAGKNSELRLSDQSQTIVLILNGNFIMITTMLINTNFQRMRLPVVATSLILFYTLALIHQYGFNGMNAISVDGGFDAAGVAFLIIIIILILMLLYFMEKKSAIEVQLKMESDKNRLSREELQLIIRTLDEGICIKKYKGKSSKGSNKDT